MKTQNAGMITKNGLKLLAALGFGLGLVVANVSAYYRGVEGYAGPSEDSGSFDNVPTGATVDAEISSNSGTASMTISGCGVYINGSVSGAANYYESTNNHTTSSGSVSYYLYANGGNSYAVVSVWW